jgi:hypothetical protein
MSSVPELQIEHQVGNGGDEVSIRLCGLGAEAVSSGARRAGECGFGSSSETPTCRSCCKLERSAEFTQFFVKFCLRATELAKLSVL